MLSKTDQLSILKQEGFKVVHHETHKGHKLTDEFLANYLSDRRNGLDYMIDGLVLDINDAHIREDVNPSRDTLNPAYSIKYKVADADNLATAVVKKIHLNVSKHGYIKPTIEVEPVDLVGVTITRCTGFNMNFIYVNQIQPGCTISITRSGDVIPLCLGVLNPGPLSDNDDQFDDWFSDQLNAVGEWNWTETGVDAVLIDINEHNEVAVQQTIDCFASLEIPHLKEGTVRKLFDKFDYPDSIEAIQNILHYTESDWNEYIGENGIKIHAGLRSKLTKIAPHVFMGSLPFFGRGIGKRKFKKMEQVFGPQSMFDLQNISPCDLLEVEGFQQKSVDKILSNFDDFLEFIKGIPRYVTFKLEDNSTIDGELDGQKICMTGFRDKELSAQIEALGGTIQSTVNSKTTLLIIKDPNSTSSKAKKARDLGIAIVGVEEFKNMHIN